MTAQKPEDFTIDTGPMGAIGESWSLMLRINRNCPWNRCLFCRVYKQKRFGIRSVEDIKRDIDNAERIRDLIEAASREDELGGPYGKEIFLRIITRHPEIYGRYPYGCTRIQYDAQRSLGNVANWVAHGARRVFLQDADALAMKPAALFEVLKYLKSAFPAIDTITCYARSKTLSRRYSSELRDLKEAGLTWCFVGIESGCDSVLSYMKKGVSREEHIDGGRKAAAAGLKIAAFVMPGLSGANRDMARKHISETAAVLNEIRPAEVRVRSLSILEGSPLHDRLKSREFMAAEEDQMIEEIRWLIEALRFDCTFETLQMTNPLFNLKGRFYALKSEMIEKIDRYLAMPPLEKARFLLNKYADGGYVKVLESRGSYDPEVHRLIADARKSIDRADHDAVQQAARAVFSIKSKGVP